MEFLKRRNARSRDSFLPTLTSATGTPLPSKRSGGSAQGNRTGQPYGSYAEPARNVLLLRDMMSALVDRPPNPAAKSSYARPINAGAGERLTAARLLGS